MADAELQDHVTVTVNVPTLNIPNHPVLAPVLADLKKRIQKANSLKSVVGSRVANRARINQMESINALDAICSGALYNSIRVQGGNGDYTIGTNSLKKGYYCLVHGRGAIDLSGQPGRAMHYRPKCGGAWIVTKRVGPAAPKNYIAHSSTKTESDITHIVEEEVNRAMA